MDIDIDMDVPLLEELEYLESHLQEDLDYEEFEPPTEPYPEEEDRNLQTQPNPEPTKPTLSIPTKPTLRIDKSTFSHTQTSAKKRFRSDCPGSSNSGDAGLVEDKRSRIETDDFGDGVDTEWILLSPSPRNEGTNVEEPGVVEEEKIVSKYASEIDGEFLPVTGLGGERVYAKICRVEKEDSLKKLDVRYRSNGLIPEPISVLMQRVEHNAFTKVMQASVEGESGIALSETPVANEQLWVDKYAPKSFTELLSDEQTNREVLLWLKQWDACVFGSEIRSTTDDVLSSLRRHSSVSQNQKPSSQSSFGRNRGFRSSKDSFKVHTDLNRDTSNSNGIQELWNKKRTGFGPPEQKILLLCGPPGLGKTTLAHVAATHCGYHVVEVNASDDRSSASIEAKILDVVQMNSVIADSKPKCLVIDEIDGALGDGKGAVEVILKMVSADRKSNAGKENIAEDEESGRKSSKRKKINASLLRPVICICNDLYAPALRSLRQVAKVHIFVRPAVSRIVNRLKYICNTEGMKTTSIALSALAEYTDCDIRSCLNTLQFLNKKKETLNILEISSQVVGRKDTSKSLFDIWKEIFQKRRVKRDRNSLNRCSSMSNDFDFLHSLVSNRGDYDLILDGIHENILQLNYHDPVMQKTVKCLHTLGVSDIAHQYIMRTQRMSLQVYQPSIAISIHGLIARVENPTIEWPKSYQRYRTTLMEKIEVLHSWHNKISPCISRHLSTKSFVEDTISPLLHILAPPTLRPVALNLLSEKERNDLFQLVNTMVSYAMTYKKMKSDPLSGSLKEEVALDASVLSFDPPLGNFISFKGYTSSHFVLALPVQQLLVHEVEKQRILQGSIDRSMHPTVCEKQNQALVVEENGRGQYNTANCESTSGGKGASAKKSSIFGLRKLPDTSLEPSTSASRNATTSTKPPFPENKKKPSGGSFNFFERFKKVSFKGSQNASDDMHKAATKERDARPLLFKFNEGFTNAVKRPVRIREFLI